MWVTKKPVQASGLFVLLALMATSCTSGGNSAGSQQTPSSETSDTSVEELPADDSKAPDVATAEDGFMEMVEVRTDLEQSIPVDVLEVSGSDSELVLTFEMGSQQCHGVEASIEEEGNEVVLNVHTGKLPEASEACVEGVYPYQVSIPLDQPLDGRPVRQSEPEEPAEEPIAEPADQALSSGRPGIEHLVGIPVEEGVQWAIENELEWQLSSYDGVARDVEGRDENRLSFEVESDKIVGIEWA